MRIQAILFCLGQISVLSITTASGAERKVFVPPVAVPTQSMRSASASSVPQPHAAPIASKDVDCRSGDTGLTCRMHGILVTVPVSVSSNPELTALPSSLKTVLRHGYYVAGDSAPVWYTASQTPCSSGRGAGDGGAQVPTHDGKCWIASFPDGGIDVRQFGARCDGRTDDTPRIQAALYAIRENGINRLVFPGGTCLISDALVIAGDSAAITGNSLYGTRILQRKPNARIFSILWSNIHISNLRLDYDGKPVEGADAIYSSGANNIFSELYIYKAYRGIAFEGMSGGFVHHVQIWRYEDSAIFIQNASDIYIDNFIFNADTISDKNAGLRIQNRAEAITVNNGDILGGLHSMVLDASVNKEGARPAFNKFSNVYFDSSHAEPVTINNSATTNFVNTWFSGGRPDVRSGLSIANSIGIHFTGATFFNNGYHGAIVRKSAKQIVFVNCQFIHNSVSQTGKASGLYFEPGTSDFMVNSSIFSNVGYESTQKSGIQIAEGPSDRYSIMQNLVTGNLGKGIEDFGSGRNKTVSSNY